MYRYGSILQAVYRLNHVHALPVLLLLSVFFHMRPVIQFASTPSAHPRTMPASTSVGKCRNRYIRLKAISAAIIKAATPAFLCCMKMAVAAPKAHAEWVDGKDELDGLSTNSTKSRSI